MFLYSLTLSQATAINHSVQGSFTAPDQQEIVVSKGKIIELLRPDETDGTLQLIYRQEAFGIIRSIDTFRLIGMKKDFLVIGSDSGRIVILEFDKEKKCFVKIHQETFGKTGARRIVPGEYLATDPKGRAIMIGAAEKQKFVYILNRDSQNQLTISSPLEAHKPHMLTLAMVGVDVGIENPQFACLEIDYGDIEQSFSAVNTGNIQKTLTFYEMDLGLNHVIRKHIIPVDISAHMLIAVPGDDGPGGILVVCEDYILYKRVDHEQRKCFYPVRQDTRIAQKFNDGRKLFITSSATFSQGSVFFFIIQSEYGDLFKVTLDCTEQQVHSIVVQYFDTLAPGISINILKTGYLFHAAEASNHGLYLFKSTGEDEMNPVICHSQQTPDFELNPALIPSFNQRALQNLEIRDEIQNLGPINDMKVEDLTNEQQSQIYLACGRGAHGTVRALRHGLQVTEMAMSPIPGRPLNVITLKQSFSDSVHQYMIVSFPESTLVLQVANDKVTQLQNSGFQTTEQTLHAGLLSTDVHIQVTNKSIIQITSEKKRTKWESDKRILLACSNSRQVVIYIEGGQLVYFELDDVDGHLKETQTKFFVETEVKCLDIGEVPEGRTRSKYLAVGFGDNTCRILSLDSDSCLQKISIQALPTTPESVCFMNVGDSDSFYLHVGLVNGVLVRSLVDNITGSFSDTRQELLGTRAIKLTKIQIQNQEGVIALSNRTHLCYHNMGKYRIVPLSYDTLNHVSAFTSERCSEGGIVAIADNSLRIIKVEKLGDQFTHQQLHTRYTPVKLLVHPETSYLCVLEKDHNAFNIQQLEDFKQQIYAESKDEEYLKAPWHNLGSYPRAGVNNFASCIRIVNPYTMKTESILEFENGETCFSFHIAQNIVGPTGHADTYLFAGVGLEAKLTPRTCSIGFIKTYKFKDSGCKLELIHSTPCENIPGAFAELKGRLLAGVGPILRIYDLGQKKLLRKQENKNFSAPIISIRTSQSCGRIFAADISESIHVLKYKPDENQLYIFADDVLKRYTNSFCLLDEDTVCGVDKFENMFVIRVPAGIEEDAEDDPTASRFKWESGMLNGAQSKMEQISQYFMGEVSTAVQKVQTSKGTELIYCATTLGGICAFLPFETKEELDFFTHLEMFLRIEAQPLAGRDHVMFRSSYAPVKDVIDGDLCEMFQSLDFNKQKILSDELDRNPSEVNKKLEQLRSKLL